MKWVVIEFLPEQNIVMSFDTEEEANDQYETMAHYYSAHVSIPVRLVVAKIEREDKFNMITEQAEGQRAE